MKEEARQGQKESENTKTREVDAETKVKMVVKLAEIGLETSLGQKRRGKMINESYTKT